MVAGARHSQRNGNVSDGMHSYTVKAVGNNATAQGNNGDAVVSSEIPINDCYVPF